MASPVPLKSLSGSTDRVRVSKVCPRITDEPVPFSCSLLQVHTGVRSFLLPRSFVTFLLHHPVAQEYLDWSRSIILML